MADPIKVRCPQCGELLRIPQGFARSKDPLPNVLEVRFERAESSASGGADPDRRTPASPTEPPVAAAEPNFNCDNFRISVRPHSTSRNSDLPAARLRGLVIGLLVMGVTAAAAFGLYRSGWLAVRRPLPSSAGHLTVEKPSKTKPEQNDNQPIVSRVHFPRRFSVIGIHQYAYANPISPTPTSCSLPSVIREFAERNCGSTKIRWRS